MVVFSAGLACQTAQTAWLPGHALPPASVTLEHWLSNEPPAGQLACPRAVARDPEAAKAYDRVNSYRRRLRLPCMSFVPEIAAAAAAHCEYYAANRGPCTADPHGELDTCRGFRGARFNERMFHTGYDGEPAYETMAYTGNGARAVDLWVDSVWHRIPILSPWVKDLGYGGNRGCDTMNFGWAAGHSTAGPVTYPYNGQTEVPLLFDGSVESPPLPRPPNGWPSGYPIIIYAEALEVETHLLLDDRRKPVPHTWIAPDSPEGRGILRREMVMYADTALEPSTAYVVRLEGRRGGWPVRIEWTFATR
jgi:uncharacterized protein YkwD